MRLFCSKKKLVFIACFVFLVLVIFLNVKQKENYTDKPYEDIVNSIKDDPQQALTDLKNLADKNNSAAMEYLILLSIYEPQKINSPEFEEIADRLHTTIIAQYEKIVSASPFYKKYQEMYTSLIKDDYMKCYKDLQCLIKVGAYNFSKFFDIWDNKSGNMLYVPWKIIVPCSTAQKLHLTAILDAAGGGHGAETLDISNCNQYSEYHFPSEVEEYHRYIQKELFLDSSGSIRYLYMAFDVYDNIIDHYDPDWDFEQRPYLQKEYLQALPLEAWAMESYPNYQYFNEVINHGIGFNKAIDMLTEHYVKTFNIDKNKAQQYARYVMIPWAARSVPVNKETLRYKILSGVPVHEIQTWIEDKKLKNEEFEELETPHQADEILMVSIHRPDVLKMLIEKCPANDGNSNCIGLNTNVNAGNSFGKTALMYASQYGFADSVKILLEAGANINAQTNPGVTKDGYCLSDICMVNAKRTALMYAVQEGNLALAKYLIEKGADINLQDSQGMTIYDYLNGKAPILGNFKQSPTADEKPDSDFPSEKYENRNVSPEDAKDFLNFLKNYQKNK